jgi:hypothetical protein
VWVRRCLPWVRGLQRHDRGSKASKTKINPYFKFELGGAKAIKKRSTPIKNSNSTPDFKGEVWLPHSHPRPRPGTHWELPFVTALGLAIAASCPCSPTTITTAVALPRTRPPPSPAPFYRRLRSTWCSPRAYWTVVT